MAKNTGRPAGSSNREYVVGNDRTSACPKCGCTDFRDEKSVPVNEHCVLIRTQCLNADCGQWRFDRIAI